MTIQLMWKQAALAGLAYVFVTTAASAAFDCPIGRRAACLSYGDKVVDQNSVCFDSYSCNFKGFICKSKFDAVVEDYDTLLRNAKSIASGYDNLRDCVRYASTLEAAQACAR